MREYTLKAPTRSLYLGHTDYTNSVTTLAERNHENRRGSNTAGGTFCSHNTVKYSKEFTQKDNNFIDSRLKCNVHTNSRGAASSQISERPSSTDTKHNRWL